MAIATSAELSLFYDDGAESEEIKRILQRRRDRCNFYCLPEISVAQGDRMVAPTLFAPEGIFEGAKQIQVFLSIPTGMRYHTLLRKRSRNSSP